MGEIETKTDLNPVFGPRPRRLRRGVPVRELVRETDLNQGHLIYPMFVVEGKGIKEEIPSMPGQYRYSPDQLPVMVEWCMQRGVTSFMLFGQSSEKDPRGSGAWKETGAAQEGARTIKSFFDKDVLVMTDVCLCSYTDHGHCGVANEAKEIDNDETLELLAKTAVSHAAAGADWVAPSDMMDGRVAAIRDVLDENGFSETAILSYGAKYASAFYGPFRDAADSTPQFGDRRTYQMDPGNIREAMKEIELDIDEGADAVMVKPALAYLDVIKEARGRFDVPIAAYCVSGEYSMVAAAAQKGWLNEPLAAMEILTAIRRAGADMILTYWAPRVPQWLQK